MANIFTGKIIATDYTELFDEAEFNPTEGNKYTIQITGGIAYFREGDEGRGFLVNNEDIITFTQETDDLFIKTNPNGVVVNIAEKVAE